jgi:hypothetical protein
LDGRIQPSSAAEATAAWQNTADSLYFGKIPSATHAPRQRCPHSITSSARASNVGGTSSSNGGLIVMPDTFMFARHACRSLRWRLTIASLFITPWRFNVEVGGLISYGLDVTDNFRRAAGYADRILNGEKPSELPVQAPVKFELAINLKTAKALGLDVPWILQQRADEVIE